MSEITDGARGARLPRSVRRQQLLSAAQEVFVANGYHAAAMDEIADRAGVSKPVLYQHFPGKLDLYLAIIDTHTEALIDAIRTGLAATEDNRVRVHNVLSAYFDFVDGEARGDGGVFRLLFESDLANDPAVRERRERISQATSDAVADTVAGDTGLSRAEAELLAGALTGAAEVAARWWLQSGKAVRKHDAVRLMADLQWRGISHFPLQAHEAAAESGGVR
ncbi:MAG: TetR/AcrR family transcriptional regulator [Actinomycetota bacterium]|nr:TetR/AcrR family transcriptional regulator [Actinomycetota bacterium]